RHLDRLDPDRRRSLWARLLSPYWRDRSTNMPLALDPMEVMGMISWIPALPEVADEAAEELMTSPANHIEHADGILFDWANEDHPFVLAHPDAAVRVVTFLIRIDSINS